LIDKKRPPKKNPKKNQKALSQISEKNQKALSPEPNIPKITKP
jgi:hypothetical protein